MKLRLAMATVALLHASVIAAPLAEDLHHQAQTAYDHGDYATAIAKWRASYELSSASGLLFNLAQAYRKSGDCKQALSTYKQFISIDPTADPRRADADRDRRDANNFVHELEPLCGAPIAAPIVDHPLERRRRALKIAGLATGTIGVASIAVGLGFGLSGRRDAAVGYAFDAIGAAAFVGGAILYYLGDQKSAVTVAPPSANAKESGAIVSWRGSW